MSFIPEWTQRVSVKNPANNLMQIFAHKSAEIAERISAAKMLLLISEDVYASLDVNIQLW